MNMGDSLIKIEKVGLFQKKKNINIFVGYSVGQ